MIEFKSPRQIAIMREANLIVHAILDALEKATKPGVSTDDLDQIAVKLIREYGAESAFKGYRGYPKVLCASVNEEVVHTIPSARPLKEGDIISLDFGVVFKGYVGDSARTVPVGKITAAAAKLIRVAHECLQKGITQMVPGNKISDIGKAVQGHAEAHGYSVVRDFVGHGIGRAMHEDPQVPNYWDAGGRDYRLRPGMVLAVEPMVNMGTHEVKLLDDGWTVLTADGKLSAHFEDSIAITKDGPFVLSQP